MFWDFKLIAIYLKFNYCSVVQSLNVAKWIFYKKKILFLFKKKSNFSAITLKLVEKLAQEAHFAQI